ncbi:MAG: transporter substrate-binding domain-containing protein [Alphaproteobacteria bacterium]|nr:transporter substrate-binding domain-containing protein [Alphaproteobacteria bacterium]
MKGMRLMAAALAVVAATGLAAGPVRAEQDVKQQLSASSLLEEIKKRGTMRVGLSTFVPWAMRDTSGELMGFEIDVAKKMAEDLEVKVEFVPTAWDGIIPALIAGKFDFIISGMSITPKRNLTVNFSIPYAHSGQQLVANKKLAGGFKTVADFNKADVTLTCRRGVTSCAWIQKNMPKATLRQFDDDAQASQEVLNGNAHGWMASAPRPKFLALDNADVAFMPFAENLTRGDESIALRKGDPDTLNWLDNWVLFYTSNGWLQERNDAWFSNRDWKDKVAKN